MNPENLDESLAEIRQAAKEYYARKSGTWKPKRDLDAERLEDEARFSRESMALDVGSLYSTLRLRMMRYSSGPEKIVRHVPPDPEKIERIRKAFVYFDMSDLESRMKVIVDKMRRETAPDMVILDELPTSSPIPELKDYQHKFLYGDWVDSTAKIGEGKNPMAEHTIRGVKKSHAKRRFSKKSRRGIL